MNKSIKVTGESDEGKVPIRRIRNTRGTNTVPMNVTIPIELNQTINGILATSNKSRSLIISELLQKGLEAS